MAFTVQQGRSPSEVCARAAQVYYFPSGASSLGGHPGWFAALAAAGLVTSFTSTLMFTSLGGFFNRISDPGMGGAYLTLLNTIANMGARGAVFVFYCWCASGCMGKGARGCTKQG